MPGMKIHKLEPKDFKVITEFIQACEAMLERGKFSLKSPYEEWREWDDDDKDKQKLLKIENYISKNEDMEDVDGRIIAYEYLLSKYTHLLTLLNITADVLIDNCCDPMENSLEFLPSLTMCHVAPEQ